MRTLLLLISISMLLFTSCVKQTAEYQALKAQNDSLLMAKEQLQSEVDEFFSAMNQIELNIEKIKSAENVITIQPASEELSDDARTKINNDLAYLNEMIKANKEELKQLTSKLKNSAFKSAELERTITRLTKALEEESSKVARLQQQLIERDATIEQLGTAVKELSDEVEVISKENVEKQVKITQQDEAIHSAWYVFGTRKELREQNIITSDGLFSARKVLQSDFNKSYFVRIDLRKTKSIPLYSSRAKILTTHPKSSYTLEKENGNYTLLIVNTEEFWSVSKYLVIEVD